MAELNIKKEHENLLAQARERFYTINTAETHIREAALEDIKFTYNIEEGQWPQEVRDQRREQKRPCLTANKLRKFVAIVANQERENLIGIKVRGVDDQADPNTALVFEDLIRQIEYQSEFDRIVPDAGEQAAAGSFGYWRLRTKYPDDGFDQEIFIEHIENPFSVYMDPHRRYAFITNFLSKEEFRAEYPKAAIVDFPYQGLGERWALWYEHDKIRVSEYFQKEPAKWEIAKVVNPSTGQIKVFRLSDEITDQVLINQGYQIIQRREVNGLKVRWYKMTGAEILEESDWPGKDIPIIEVVGDKINVEGKTYKRSLIRDGKDPQRMYNYWNSSATETVALQPKSPYLVTPQQLSGHEYMWDKANEENRFYLLYNAQGQQIPKREPPPQLSTGHQMMLQAANLDIKDSLGMYESFLGEQSNERSGLAVRYRQQRSQLGTFHFPDNVRRAVVETGRQLIDIIPHFYDAQRRVRLRNEQGEERLVTINETVTDAQGNKQIIYDLQMGRYDVQSDIRLYSTRRQETAEMILQAMQYSPGLAPFIAHLLFKYIDSPAAKELEEAVKQFTQFAAQQGNGNTAKPPQITNPLPTGRPLGG